MSVGKYIGELIDGLLELPHHQRIMMQALARIESRQGNLVTAQERANEIAANIAEDVETIAKVSDAFTAANTALKTEIEGLKSQLSAAQVDFTGLDSAAASVDSLADALSATLNPDVPTPDPSEIPDVPAEPAPVEPAPTETPAEPAPETPAETPAEPPVEPGPVVEPAPVAVEPAPVVEPAPAAEPTAETPAEAPVPAETPAEGEGDTGNSGNPLLSQ